MTSKKNIPDFFIVGAPKCGTSALDFHLSLHPEIFMAKKEIHYFGSDIGIIQDSMSEEDYISFFNEDNETNIKGESSVWYLFSNIAAKEIYKFNSDAKIIIMLRKPTDMIPSLHSQYIFNGIETEKDFNIAFKSDLNRDKDYPCAIFKNRPKFIESSLYSAQVKRYLDVFPRENIHIILHEDLTNEFNQVYKQTLEFIGVTNRSFIPNEKKINSRKEVKNISLHHMSKKPPKGLKKVFRTLVPSKTLRHSLMKWIENKNVSEKNATEIDKDVRECILNKTRDDIQILAQLIDKDLSHWLE